MLVNLSFLSAQPTGISIYAQNLYPYLRSLHPTFLVSESALSQLPESHDQNYLIPDNLTPMQGSKGHLNRLLWTQFEVPKIYQKLNANLIFSPITEAPIFAGCRYIVTVHDIIPLRFPRLLSPLTNYFRTVVPQVLNQAQHIICNSDATAKDVMEFFNIPSDRVTSIPLAYDSSHFRHLNLAPDHPYFLYIGRHDRYKNLHRLIAAFAKLNTNHDCELWLAGSSDRRYTPDLKLQAQELGISSRVKFLDYVTYAQLPILLNQAIALVFPSLWEGFGLPVLEAMACGTPVITSNLSSLPEVAGDAALLIDPYNILEITHAMQEIMKERSHFQQAGLRRAKDFSWEITGSATVKTLSKFI